MENNYAKGIYFNKVKDDLPESVRKWKKGSLAVNLTTAVDYLKTLAEHQNEKGYVYFDLTLNEKDGEKFYSFKLNTWKPEERKPLDPPQFIKEAREKEVEYTDSIDEDAIPF